MNKGAFFLTVGLFWLSPATPVVATEIPVGTVMVSTGNGRVTAFTPGGAVIGQLDTTTGAPETAGSGFDSTENFYVTDFAAQQVTKFDPNSVLIGPFGSGYDLNPESILFDSVGNVYVGQADGTHALLKFDPFGARLATFSPATERRGTDHIALAADQCTMFYTSEGVTVKRFDVCTNTQLPDFNVAPLPGSTAYGLRLLRAGGLIVADTEQLVWLDAGGNQIQTYTLPGATLLFAVSLDPDGSSFWTADLPSGKVFEVDIASGTILQQWSAAGAPSFVDVSGLSVKGEITVGSFARPQIALPTVSPAVVAVGTKPVLTVSVSISYPDQQPVLPGSVTLLQIADTGQATVLTTLNDNGTAGDAVAGDSIFSGRVQLHAVPIGLIRLQVSAAFANTPGPVLSPIATVEVLPSAVPLTIQPSDLGQCVTSPSGGELISNELLLFFEPGTSYGTVVQTASRVAGRVIGLQSFPRFNIWQVRIRCSTASCVEAAVEAVQDNPSILRAEPNFCTHTLGVTPNDPLFRDGTQYGPQRIQADRAWAITKGDLVTNRNRVPFIAIVDSGMDETHLEFAGRVVKAKNYTNVAFADDCDHGTGVAGVAGAKGNNGADIAGISWYAQLVDLKVTQLTVDPLTGQAKCKGTTLAGAAAFREAVAQGATVINYSVGGAARAKAEAQAIEYVNNADRLLVAAAGNDNGNVKVYPAAFGKRKECFGAIFQDCYNATNVGVGATDRNDMRWVDPATGDGSNWGDWVLFYAPGANIETTRAGGGTAPFSGSSYAAPHVAGTASLAKASDPSRSMFSVYRRLGDDQVGNDPNGTPMARINAFKTVLAVSARDCGTCPGPPTVKLSPRDATVRMGTPDAPKDGSQAVSVHGVSIPLDAAATYQVTFDGGLSTWDSCSEMAGFRDCFSVSVSAQPFWMITRDDRSPTLNRNLSVGSLYGGQARGNLSTLNILTGIANMQSLGADNFLNVVLDTAAGTKPDRAFPSWGAFRILDITPR